jgi:hypothetical protein
MTPLARHLAATALAAGCLLGTATAAGAVTPDSGAAAAPAAHSRMAPASTQSTVCSVNAASATIRNQPGGDVIGTMYLGYRFRIDSDDSVWPYGAGYDPNGNLIAYGYILRQYLAC